MLFDIAFTVHNNMQQSSTSKECMWKQRATPNEKSCSLEDLKISKSEYGKSDKKAPKPTAFDPSSTELDPVSFMDCLKVGLQEHVPSAVILQVFPQASPVEVTEKEVTDIISNVKSVEHEEEVVAVEVNTISELRDTFLAAKGFDSGESFSVTEEICNEFLDFIKINDDQAAMIFQKTKMQGNFIFFEGTKVWQSYWLKFLQDLSFEGKYQHREHTERFTGILPPLC